MLCGKFIYIPHNVQFAVKQHLFRNNFQSFGIHFGNKDPAFKPASLHLYEEESRTLKHTDYLKKKKNREIRRRIVSILSALVVFVATYALVLPALTLDVKTARMEPGMSVQQSADPRMFDTPKR